MWASLRPPRSLCGLCVQTFGSLDCPRTSQTNTNRRARGQPNEPRLRSEARALQAPAPAAPGPTLCAAGLSVGVRESSVCVPTFRLGLICGAASAVIEPLRQLLSPDLPVSHNGGASSKPSLQKAASEREPRSRHGHLIKMRKPLKPRDRKRPNLGGPGTDFFLATEFSQPVTGRRQPKPSCVANPVSSIASNP